VCCSLPICSSNKSHNCRTPNENSPTHEKCHPQMLRLCCLLLLVSLAAGQYVPVALVSSDFSIPATVQDPTLVNAWGVSFTPTGPFWVSRGARISYCSPGKKKGFFKRRQSVQCLHCQRNKRRRNKGTTHCYHSWRRLCDRSKLESGNIQRQFQRRLVLVFVQRTELSVGGAPPWALRPKCCRIAATHLTKVAMRTQSMDQRTCCWQTLQAELLM
jgi:hypothetical protein